MNQDEARREDERPLESAVEQHDQALEQVKEALGQAGPKDQGLQQAVEEEGRRADEVKRELSRQDTGTLPKSKEAVPEPPPQEPIGGLG